MLNCHKGAHVVVIIIWKKSFSTHNLGSPDCSTNLYVLLNGGLTGVYYRGEILEAFVHLYVATWASPLCLWTKTPVHTGLVLSKSTLNTKGIESMD